MWHDPPLFCSVTLHTQCVAKPNAKLWSPSFFVFGFLSLSVEFSSCVLLLCLFKHQCAM